MKASPLEGESTIAMADECLAAFGPPWSEAAHSFLEAAEAFAPPVRYNVTVASRIASGTEWPVPTLIRLLLVIGVLVALAWGAMLAMVTYLQPHPREITRDLQLPGKH